MQMMKNKFSSSPAWQDFNQISDSFDLALSPEVIGWFHQKNGNVHIRQSTFTRYELDEHEQSLT